MDDTVDHGQAHTRALADGLSGVKRLKGPLGHVGCQTGTGIIHRQRNVLAVDRLTARGTFALKVPRLIGGDQLDMARLAVDRALQQSDNYFRRLRVWETDAFPDAYLREYQAGADGHADDSKPLPAGS